MTAGVMQAFRDTARWAVLHATRQASGGQQSAKLIRNIALNVTATQDITETV